MRAYRSMRDCVEDLEARGFLKRITAEVDPNLEAALVHRLAYQRGGPAILFEKIKGSPFPAVSNLFGTQERAEFVLRNALPGLKQLIRAKADPASVLKAPWNFWRVPFAALNALPLPSFRPSVMECETSLSSVPQIKSWQEDGGAFITLPQVLSQSLDKPGLLTSNLGMYRIQISGNEFEQDREAGMHYQLHRGIGIHHGEALRKDKPMPISIFVGGPPGNTVAAVMPLPEGLSELIFCGLLSGRNFRFYKHGPHVVSADADFCILGWVHPQQRKPEGPFGDHLGYYSLRHDFPVLTIEKVYHRRDAIWPFTVVGRPPQEDTTFGKLIHTITEPLVSSEIPGVRALNAVDAAGVHPLLLAIASERYVPDQERKPREILTAANAILGFGQCSLAKYLLIAAFEDKPNLNVNDESAFFTHVLERIDWRTDCHFQTCTTIDTLDYSGTALNEGSKVVFAAAGKKKRNLATELESRSLRQLGENSKASLVAPGVVAFGMQPFTNYEQESVELEKWSQTAPVTEIDWSGVMLLLLVEEDQVEFVADRFENFLWVCFTRSNPSHDIYGVGSFQQFKHWGCKGPLIIDARIKPHHAPPLVDDPAVVEKAENYLTSIC